MNTGRLTLYVLLAASAACGGSSSDPDDPIDEGAKLTIVGDSNVYLENGWQREITVRYSDNNGVALAGTIGFAFAGNAQGAVLNRSSAQTDANGTATVSLTAGRTGNFDIEATAAEAAPVRWRVQVAAIGMSLDLSGVYTVASQFDMTNAVPGGVGTVLSEFIEMTDDPSDPATWILDQIQANAGGTVEDVIRAGRPLLDGVLNSYLLQFSRVQEVRALGDALGDAARRFGTTSTLNVVRAANGQASATHRMHGISLTFNGQPYSWAFSDLGLPDSVAQGVGLNIDQTGRVALTNHNLGVSLGAALVAGVNQILIPQLDGSAQNLAQLLPNMVDCYEVGWEIYDAIDFFEPSTYEAVCVNTLAALGQRIEDRIRELNGNAVQLSIAGTARAQDNNADKKADVFLGGVWTGTVSGNALGASTFRADRASAVP